MSLNHDTLDALREFQNEGEPDFLTELIDAYVSDSPQRIQGMRDGLEKGDMAAFGKSAHALKGSSGNLGAEALFTLCLQAEKAGKGNDSESARSVFPLIEKEFALVRDELMAMRKP